MSKSEKFTFARMEQPVRETDFLAAILRGDRPALEAMYRSLFPLTRKLVTDLYGSEADAQDIFQDAVMVVFQKASQPDFVLVSKFSTFFYGICHNLWLNRLQKKSFSHVTIPESAKLIVDENAEIDFSQQERLSLLDKAFLQLGDDCRRLLQLYLQKKSMAEIAAALNFGSEGYARRRKHQCKERLVALAKSDPTFRELMED